VGYVGAMEMLPYLLVGPYAGVIADRIDRKRIMLLSDVCSAIALLVFSIFVFLLDGKPPVWSLLAIPFVLSTMRCFFMPAKSAAIPNLVPQELLMKANALSSATFNVMFLVGLGLAAGVIGQLFDVAPRMFFVLILALNAVSFLGSAAFIAKLPQIVPDRSKADEQHPWEDFKSGLRFIRDRHDLKVLTVLLAAFRLGVAPFFVVYIAANKEWFGGRPQTLTWFEFAFFAGMVLGSVFVGKFKARRPTVAFSAMLATVGVMVGLMGFCQNFVGFVLLNFITGILIPFGDVPIITYLQVSVEDAFRGRVNAVREMIATGVMPIGMVLAGTMLHKLGLVPSFMVMAAVMLVAALSGMLDKRYRRVEMPEEVHENTSAMSAGAAA
ncbi:MAG: transporter, family, macrolide efflux protein, partial [Fimbriimonadaceae bacterium]|nr:transporter, family, macrolide efflux protein [Fimbriimonadaceae bacterium]